MEESLRAGGWVRVLAAGWVIWSREGRKRYVESTSMARRMPDLGAPEVVVLATRNVKARPTIVRRFRKSRRATSPPPLLAANRTATRPSLRWSPPLGLRCHRPQVAVTGGNPSARPTVGSRRPGGSCSAKNVQRLCRPSR